MNFDHKNTTAYKAIKREAFLLFKFSKFLRDGFLFLFILALCLVLLSFLNFVSLYFAIKLTVLFFSFYLVFWNVGLFTDFKIKKPNLNFNLADAVKNPDDYNLAELLSFNAEKIVLGAVKFSKKRNLSVSSTALFYSALKESEDVNLICFRLGLDTKKLQEDLKNYSEKMGRQNGSELFSEDFKQTITEALNMASNMGHTNIGEKDLLTAMAKCSEPFKKTLIEFDLKEKDVENLAVWLDSAENSLERSKKFWSYENLSRAGSMGKDWASGYTITLDQFSTDWRRVVSKWAFKEIVGHEKEIDEAGMILARSNLANVLIVGEPGTGRKSIVEAVAQKCYLGNSLPELNNKRVVELDLVQLTSRVQDFEKLETTLDQIFSEVIGAGNVILVIDELHDFVAQKTQRPGSVDISGILTKYLAIPSFQFIGITSYDGLHRCIEQNRSFADFFRKVEVSEITEAETIKVLQNYALDFEYRYKILILYPALREIVNLTSRYMPSLPFPKKATDILDEAVVYLQTLKEKVVMPHHIAEIISQKTEIPVGKMDVKEKEVLLNLENLIHQRIVNQAEAVKEISIAMRRARAGIGSKKRPMGTFLFLGPTGVGKTETSKALAEIYFGRPSSAKASDGQGEKMIRLDMSEFQAIADIPRLIGAVSPVEMQGLLTTPVRETPFSLVLIDEIEKAHPDILNLFLQILDEGHITDGQGRKVVFTNTIIICTSNAGADIIFKELQAGNALDKQKLISGLISRGLFRPEFVNRFDATVAFHFLTKENLLAIAGLMLGSLKKNLEEKEFHFEITDALKEAIVELSYKPEFGAREMRRVIQDKVENAVAEALLSDKIKKTDSFEINPETFELIINPVN
ncbi:MAG: ATP-dependent Clp protease ATP-binding subunit [Candidatus Staskawiczbacteria bacterium]|nr:ATP-dependent Clp protease ATP-binding subunit [Candidatus Staskawiczbacteria bacterium]